MDREFSAIVEKTGSRVVIPIPFDPNEAWGARARHHLTGTINGATFRGALVAEGGRWYLPLGPAWRRDCGINAGDHVQAVLSPEGPQQDNMAADITTALGTEPQARAFFEGLPTFYRKNYVRWIESAKRPETRENRIREMVALLREGRRER
ncbi:MAG: YdeI/OmpD-associated family protein [Tepidiformaceae bacterium]